ASIFAFHRTGSARSFALIWDGESSAGSGTVLLFSSPAGANGLGILSRYAPSAIVTAPIRIRSQSASVFGILSIRLPFVITVPTASKTKSEAGSIMSRISSLTETTGLRSPHHSCWCEPAGAACGVAADAGADVEQAEVNSASARETGKRAVVEEWRAERGVIRRL